MAADREIDQLYSLPLSEFTAARNQLASSRGKAGAAVKKLAKPSLAAWVVNQIYWHHRAAYDAVVAATESRRTAHGRVLSGRNADLTAADRDHQAAIKTAIGHARTVLRESRETESPATIAAVTETLQALPGSEPPGRLTRPLTLAGFEALAGLVPGGGAGIRAITRDQAQSGSAGAGTESSKPTKPEPGTTKARSAAVAARRVAEAARREAHARRRDAAQVEKQVKAARAAERLADAAFARARQALSRTERERERLEDQLKFADKQAQDLVAELQRHEQALAKAAAARTQLERRLAALKA